MEEKEGSMEWEWWDSWEEGEESGKDEWEDRRENRGDHHRPNSKACNSTDTSSSPRKGELGQDEERARTSRTKAASFSPVSTLSSSSSGKDEWDRRENRGDHHRPNSKAPVPGGARRGDPKDGSIHDHQLSSRNPENSPNSTDTSSSPRKGELGQDEGEVLNFGLIDGMCSYWVIRALNFG